MLYHAEAQEWPYESAGLIACQHLPLVLTDYILSQTLLPDSLNLNMAKINMYFFLTLALILMKLSMSQMIDREGSLGPSPHNSCSETFSSYISTIWDFSNQIMRKIVSKAIRSKKAKDHTKRSIFSASNENLTRSTSKPICKISKTQG